eukprot:scaffold10995_cov115-Skeletonema_marinoi.AAC.2
MQQGRMHKRGYHRRSVLLRDAVIYLEEEVCALDMEQRSNYGAVRDAQKILPSQGVCMRHGSKPMVKQFSRDAQTTSCTEESAVPTLVIWETGDRATLVLVEENAAALPQWRL